MMYKPTVLCTSLSYMARSSQAAKGTGIGNSDALWMTIGDGFCCSVQTGEETSKSCMEDLLTPLSIKLAVARRVSISPFTFYVPFTQQSLVLYKGGALLAKILIPSGGSGDPTNSLPLPSTTDEHDPATTRT